MTEDKEDEFVWNVVFIIFSVTLYFSIYNASVPTQIFRPGDFLYRFYGVEIEDKYILSAFSYFIGMLVNVCIVSYIWKKKWIKKIESFNWKILVAFLLGSTPMFLYWLMFIFSKSILKHPL